MSLKPQDSLLLLKYWSLNKGGLVYSMREIAKLIAISSGEVSKAAKRLVDTQLLVDRNGMLYAESSAMIEWFCFGVRYAYPQAFLGYGRGIPTSWNCPHLDSEMTAPSPALVWAMPNGTTEGILVSPFHDSVAYAASRDNNLYIALSLVEAIRGGKPRELKIARRLFTQLIDESE